MVVIRILQFLLAAAATVALVGFRSTAGLNAVTGAAMLLILFVGLRRGSGRAGDLPMPRRRGFEYFLPAAVAALAAAPTLALPFFADDFCLYTGRGSLPNFWYAVQPDPDQMFLRPVGWTIWWLLGKYHISPAAAHALAVVMFAASAALAAPALRKLGMPRGAAVWSAVFFALHPFALETVSWLANYYSLCSLGFALAAIVVLPVRKFTFWRGAGCFLLAILSFLSKEEAIPWLPVAAIFIVSRGKLARLPKAFLYSLPIVLAAGAAVLLRFVALDGIGGYKDMTTGRPVQLWHYRRGLTDALAAEIPSYYFIPTRASCYPPEARGWLRLLGLAFVYICAFAKPNKPAARALLLLLLLFLPMMAPVSAMIPVAHDLAGGRLIFSFSLFFCAAAAALIASFPGGKILKLGAMLLLGSSLAVAGIYNFKAWEASGRLVHDGLQFVTKEVAELMTPRPIRIAIVGFPDSVSGVVCLRNATSAAMTAAMPDDSLSINAPPLDLGNVQFVYEVDYKDRRARLLPNPDNNIILEAGQPILFNLQKGSLDRGLVHALSVTQEDGPEGEWLLRGNYFGSGLLLPTIRGEKHSKLQLKIDGRVEGGAMEWIVTRRMGELFERKAYQQNDSIEFGEGVLVAIELRLSLGATLHISSLTVFNLQ